MVRNWEQETLLLMRQLVVYLFLYSLKKFSFSQPWRAHQTSLRDLLAAFKALERFFSLAKPYT